MKQQTLKKILSVLLALFMAFQNLQVVPTRAADDESTWTQIAWEDITSSDVVAITHTSSNGTTYILPTAAATSSGPKSEVVTPEDTALVYGTEAGYGWTISDNGDGTRSIIGPNGALYMIASSNNGVRISGTTSAAWSFAQDHLSGKDQGGTVRYLGATTAGQNGPDWRAYTTLHANVAGTTKFWKLNTGGEPDPTAPAAPTASPAAGEVEKGTVVTFSTETSGATISYLVEGAAAWTEGNTYTVNEDVTLKAKASKDGLDSEEAAFAYTVKEAAEPEPTDSKVYKLSSELATGDKVIIYNAGSGKAVSSTIKSTYYLTPAALSVSSDTIVTDDATVEWEVTVNDDGTYTFTQGTLVLGGTQTTNSAGNIYNNIVLSNPAASKWTLSGETLYLGELTSKYASEGGQIYLEYYERYDEFSLFDTSRNTTDAFKFAFYKLDENAEPVEPVTKYTVTVEPSEGGTVTVSKTSVEEGEEVVITVTPNEGYELEKLLVNNVETEVTGGKATVKITADTTVKATFKKTSTDPQPADSEVEWVLVEDAAELTDGDQVIVYNASGKYAMSNKTLANYYRDLETVTIEDGKVVNPPTTAIWNLGVKTDASGAKTYTFTTQDGHVLSAGTRNSLPLDDVNQEWNITRAATDGAYYIINVGRSTQYVEYYSSKNEFSAYSYSAANEAIYAMHLYKAVEKEDRNGLITDLSTLEDGDLLVVYNESGKYAMSNKTLANYYRDLETVTIEDGKVVNPADTALWTLGIKTDESGAKTYTFTTQDGHVLSAGTRNSLPLDDANQEWNITEAATDGAYYIINVGRPTQYVEYYSSKNEFSAYSYSAANEAVYAMKLYRYVKKDGTDPVETGDLVTSLDQLKDGTTVAIYSPGHGTAISTKPNGDWYLKANQAVIEDGKVKDFTSDYVWTVKVNENGTYSFISYDNPAQSITVWPSGNYAEVTVNYEAYAESGDNTWTLTPAKTQYAYYISSPSVSGTSGAAYLEAYVRNEFEVFSGYFTSPSSNKFTESEFALQFYLINPEDAIEAYDDGEWDGVLNKGDSYVAYNFAAESSIGLFKEANYAMDAIPTTIVGDLAKPGNGAYVFTVDTMGRYYSFELNGKYLATNNDEELFFVEKDENGVLPETAKWFLQAKNGGYIIYNKEASYNGTPVCIEYYSSVFSGWTYSTKNDVNIYLFKFYKVTEDTKIVDGVVQDPKVIFDGDILHYPEDDYAGAFSLDDLAESVESISIYLSIKGKQIPVTEYETDESGKTYKFTVPAETIDAEGLQDGETFELHVEVKNSYAIEYEGVLEIPVVDEPFFYDEKPEAGSQTGEDKKPVVSVKVGNVGENPEFTMVLSGETVETVYEDKTVSYTPAEDMEDGFYTVTVTVKREDGKEVNFSWGFYVGDAKYQRYFGQLHSHTTYSDGSGTLETALDYIASLPESANVQFVAFTDHSNYFDTTSAANPADAMNDKSLMTDASRALWEQYKNTVAQFNEEHKGLVAIAGYEMTWSGGPGHINSFSTDGLVSRNNAALNNKSGDAGMKLYYETMIKDPATIQQFNHPGNTFGNFTDFAYWTEEYDRNMFLVEVGNGEGQIGAGGYYPSYEQYDLALSKGWHVAPTNNQDNHKGRWGNANDARDVVLADKLTEEDIYNAIRALRVYSTEDKNLEIDYTVNDMPMGTVFSEEDALETMNVVVTVFDPDKSDKISKVELIVENGVTAYTWDNADQLAAGELTAELEPEHSYYYVRVTQEDGDLAVTAPIWVTKAAKVGVTEIKSADEKVYTGKEATLVTTLFNNEEKAATVKSLTYTVNGSEVIGTDTTERTLAAGGTLDVEFKHTFDAAKVTKVTVTAVIEYDGKEGSYIANVELDVIDEETENVVTPIADVRAASDPEDTGYRFVIEGVVTSNASGYDKDTAFFDCVYVQDETGGICVFPVSGEYKIGDKVHIVGHTDFYQGEPELQVQTIEVIGEGEVAPEEVTAKQIADREAEGKLVTLKGTIVSVEEANGLILAIIVKDANGDEARVFIDGYITTENEIKNAVVGNKITATGLASYDDTWADTDYLPRIRVRDRADVVCEEPLEAPVIIEHPESLTVRSGNEASFKVVAEGEDLQYQWYYRTSETGTWAKSTATCANTDTYTLPASSVISWRSGYQYRCEVKNSAGSVMSNEATLTVTKTPKPVIIEQPKDVTVRSGTAASFKVVAEGENLQYQWYYRTSETGTWAKSTATCANTDTYTLPASSVISWRSGYQYRCVVSTKGGYVISDTATLTVTKTPAPVITGQPQSVSAKPGTEVSFTVEAEGEDLKYQWYYRTSSTGTWAKSTSSCATEATYTLPGTSVVKKRNGYEYRCVVYNKGGNVISEAAVLKIVATANEVRPDNLFSVTAYGY